MSVDLNTLLDKPVDEYKVPVPLPVGTYFGTIVGRKVDTVKGEKETPYIRFTIKVTHAGEDVEGAEEIDFSEKTLWKDYFLTEKAGYRFKQLAESLQISTQGKTSGELMEEMLGAPVMITVKKRLDPRDTSAPGFNDVADMKAAS